MKQEFLEAASAAGKGSVVAIAAGSIFGYTLGDAAAFAALIYTTLLVAKLLIDSSLRFVRWLSARKARDP